MDKNPVKKNIHEVILRLLLQVLWKLTSYCMRVAGLMRKTPVAANILGWRRRAFRTRSALQGKHQLRDQLTSFLVYLPDYRHHCLLLLLLLLSVKRSWAIVLLLLACSIFESSWFAFHEWWRQRARWVPSPWRTASTALARAATEVAGSLLCSQGAVSKVSEEQSRTTGLASQLLERASNFFFCGVWLDTTSAAS